MDQTRSERAAHLLARRAKQKPPKQNPYDGKKAAEGSVGEKHLVKPDLFLETSEIVFGLKKEHLG